MQFIAEYWWIWLIGLVFFMGYAFFSQFQLMKSASSQHHGHDGDKRTLFRGIGAMMASGFLGSVSGILLAIAVVVNIIMMVKS